MNRELYIHTLSQFRDECDRKHMDTETEAFNAAIQALSADGDCISRQAAIDVASGYCHPANVADELRKLPSAQPEEPQWIPVEERLPEKYKYVLTTYTIQPWRSKKPKRFVHIAEWMGDGWQSPIDEYLVRDEVAKIRYLAWVPSPEPWRGEINGDTEK